LLFLDREAIRVQWVERVRQWARAVKTDVIALYVAARDARTPRAAKAVALAITVYALSPIDLIPDIIPVLGLLDEALLLPLGILLAVRLIGADLMAEFRARAVEAEHLPSSRAGAALIVGLWLVAGIATAWWLAPAFEPAIARVRSIW
jgi:uncharacterized membrane protein YkvA (DUF1232 family)